MLLRGACANQKTWWDETLMGPCIVHASLNPNDKLQSHAEIKKTIQSVHIVADMECHTLVIPLFGKWIYHLSILLQILLQE